MAIGRITDKPEAIHVAVKPAFLEGGMPSRSSEL
jgi:hypothetical protein